MWRTATIFISSTFKDMHHERDIVQMAVLPRLREKFSKYKIAVRTVDLRWGIQNKTTEEDAEARILSICMKEIERSRPFFVGLLGYRYGWIPSYDIINRKLNEQCISVTEMEFINSYSTTFKSNCIYGIRSERKGYPDEYYETDPQKIDKITALRTKVASDENAFLTFEYDLKSNGDLEEKLFASLSDSISKVFDIDNLQGCPEDCFDCRALDNLVEENLYTQAGELSEQENRFVQRLLLQHSYIICNDPDNRRSLLFTNLSGYLARNGEYLIYYNNSLNNSSNKEMELLNYIAYKLSEFIDADFTEIKKDIGVSKILGASTVVRNDNMRLLGEIEELLLECKKRRIAPILVVDGFDKIISNRQLWLEMLAKFRSFIIYSPEKFEIEGVEYYSIPPADKEYVKNYIEDYYGRCHKELHHKVVEALINRTEYLKTDKKEWLDVALYWILNLGREDFMMISDMPQPNEEDKIESYFVELVNGFSDDVCDMMKGLVKKSEKVFGNSILEALNYIATSRFGLRDSDLELLLHPDWDYVNFSKFRMWFSPFLKESYGDKRWNFTDNRFKEIIRAQAGDERSIYLHMALSKILLPLDFKDPVRITDLFMHLLASGQYGKCGDIINAEDVHYIYEIRAILHQLDNRQFLSFIEGIMGECEINVSIVVTAHIYLYLMAGRINKEMDLRYKYISMVLDKIDMDSGNMNEYTFESYSVMLGDMVLRLKQTNSCLDLLKRCCEKHCKCVILWTQKYPSQKSTNARNVAIYTTASYYMGIGDFENANRYFSLM